MGKLHHTGSRLMESVAMLCRHRVNGNLVVIKEIHRQPSNQKPQSTGGLSNELDESQSTWNEIRVLSMLRHPNIIAYHDSFTDEPSDALMMVMEYANGFKL